MQLSRVKKFNKKSGLFSNLVDNPKNKKHPFKGLLLIAGLGVALVTTNSIAFADGGISEILKKWYLNKLQLVEKNLEVSVISETNNQKAELLKRLREQTENSIQELQKYAEDQEQIINQRIQEKMEEVSKTLDDANTTDIENQKTLIDENLKNNFSGINKGNTSPDTSESPDTNPNKDNY